MRLFRTFFLAAAVAVTALPVQAAVPTVEKPVAILRALDKVTARVEEIEVQTEKPYKFGTIFITVHSCRVTTPEEQPEAAAFLDVSEFKAGEGETPVFKGWMFASSPSLSAMQHPIYDIWVIGCKDPNEQAARPPETEPAGTKPPETKP